MNRVNDLKTVTAENFDEIKFEEEFYIFANKFGLAGKEFTSGRYLRKNLDFNYPDGDKMVVDNRVDDEQRLKQKAFDDAYVEAYTTYLKELQKREVEIAKGTDPATLPIPPEPKRGIAPAGQSKPGMAAYRLVHPMEYNAKLQQAEKNYRDYCEKKQQLCAELMSKLDEVLRTVVQQHDDYATAIQNDDIILLFSIVKDAATGKGAHSTYVLFSRLFRLKQKDDSAEALAHYNSEYAKTINDLEKIGNPDELWEALRNAKYVEGLKKDGIFSEKITTVLGLQTWPDYKDFGSELMRIARTTRGIQMISKANEDGLITADVAKFKKRTLICFNCGQEGHRVKECKSTLHQCLKCKKKGHLEIYCEAVSKVGADAQPDGNARGSMTNGKTKNAGNPEKTYRKIRVKKDSRKNGRVKAKAAEVDDDYDDYDEGNDNTQYEEVYVEVDAIDDDGMSISSKMARIVTDETEMTDDIDYGLTCHAMKIENDDEICCQKTNVKDEDMSVDTACVGNGHVIKNRDLITQEEDLKFRVTGFDGKATTTNVVGIVPGVGRCVFVEDAPNNLINLIKLCNDIGGYYTGTGSELIIYDRQGLVFAHARRDKEGFLSFKYGDIYPQGKSVKANVVKNTMDEHFTREERERAKLAFDLCKQLSHPGDKNLTISLDNNHFVGCYLTGKDLRNARKIFGPCTECLLSKMRAPTDKTSNTPPAELIGEKLFVDLIFYGHSTIGGIVGAVFAVDEKTGYRKISGFINKESKTIYQALLKIIQHFNSYEHAVKQIVFDDENVFRSLRSMLNAIGIKAGYTPAGLHNKRAERHIQSFKQRFEATRLSCEYVLPDELDHILAEHVIERMNSGSNSIVGEKDTCQLVTGVKSFIPPWYFGQPGIFYSPREGSKQKGEWGFYIGNDPLTPNHLLAWFPHRKGKYSRRKFIPNNNIPAGWGMKKLHQQVLIYRTSDDVVNNRPPPRRTVNRNVQSGEPIIDQTPKLTDPVLATLSNRKGDNEVIPAVSDPINVANANSDPEAQPEIENQRVVDKPLLVTNESNPVSTEVNQEKVVLPEPTPLPVKDNTPTLKSPVKQKKAITKAVNEPQPTRERLSRRAKEKNYTDGPAKMRESIPTSTTGEDKPTIEKVTALRMSLAQALSDRGNRVLTEDAINTEVRNLVDNNAIQPVFPHEVDGDVIGCHMFVTDKFDSEGNFDKRKVRAATRGDQENKINILRTDSPTVVPGSLNVLLTIASSNKDSLIEGYDVIAAFLGTPMRVGKRIFVRFDPRVTKFIVALFPNYAKYVDKAKGILTCLLLKYVYGLAEASREFNLRLDRVLKQIGFQPTEADVCVYQKNTPWGVHYICVHVDDIFSNSPSKEAREDFEKELSKHMEIKSKYDKISYLGMTIEKTKKGILVSQEGYLDKLLKKFKVDDSGKRVSTPATMKLIQDKESKPLDSASPYIGLVMSLMYLARFTRPDILFAVTYLATKCQDPTEDDYEQGLRILKYLAHNRESSLLYDAKDLDVKVYCDASHLLHSDGKGHSGAVVLLGGNHIYSFSGKQKLQARSSTEAELIALDEITTYVVWLRHLLKELNISIKNPSIIYQDNLSGVEIIEKGGNFKRTKHMVGKYGYVKEQVKNKSIRLVYKPTKQMVANMHTKPVGIEELNKSCEEINLAIVI